MNITVRQLRVFEAVARHLSYTKASRELHLSQPAVSMQIRQLEESAGLPLFEQIGKKIFLTEAGQEMFHYARAIDQQLRDLEESFANLKGLHKGKLAISVASTANYFIPTLLGVFCKRYPEIQVSLDVTNRKTLLHQLSANATDLVIMGQPPADMDLDAQVFMDNPLVLVASPEHPLANQTQIKLESLATQAILARERGSGTRDALERFLQKHNLQVKTSMEIGSNEAIKQSVEAGLGLGLLSLYTLEMELKLHRLVVLDVEHFPIMRHWYVMYRRGKRLSKVAEAFRDFLVKEARDIVQI